MNDLVSRVAIKALIVSICNPYYMMMRKVRLMKTINGNFCGFTKQESIYRFSVKIKVMLGLKLESFQY